MNTSATTKNINININKTIFFDDEHKKKIESTKFVYMAAKAGVGKSFSGDYLEAIRGWKHVDGDFPAKNQQLSRIYKDF